MEEPIWEQYALTKEEWEQLTEDEKCGYLMVGAEENASSMEEEDHA